MFQALVRLEHMQRLRLRISVFLAYVLLERISMRWFPELGS